MNEPCSSSITVMKQLELYITKDHIAMHKILFILEMALFISFLVYGITVLNDIMIYC